MSKKINRIGEKGINTLGSEMVIVEYRKNNDIVIEDDVWIGFGVLIMSGVGIKRPKNYNDLIRIISFSVS